jgi:hypothetical protein
MGRTQVRGKLDTHYEYAPRPGSVLKSSTARSPNGALSVAHPFHSRPERLHTRGRYGRRILLIAEVAAAATFAS